ncbi:antiviral reverse transcriptase Drt3b [Aquisalimonas asiatica]|uniref:Reverse transcriptase (RNA-dependent DNA polymerase) n=1 Tax=Aquisalimonas asiatica TaxID=406100 RepID=A0A1H8UX75_9GAMM|nr:antiviral reverse transcriptase Drt3b [Aquisalimonas asiatica]SEP07554.1 Reverse transcriptase (RNA-dependent DNA polymerase) [Aquisalimonas asiatica]
MGRIGRDYSFLLWRPIITDLQPYETPFIFSGYNFFIRYASRKESSLDKITREIFSYKKETIPYHYEAALKDGKKRDLSVIHPATQLNACDFYDKYNYIMLDRCARSSFSLRRPKDVASLSWSPKENQSWGGSYNSLAKDIKKEKIEISDEVAPVFYSYFEYSKFDRLYKFHESEEFMELERRFSRLCELDVSRCFYNIYTHSISWAVKKKQFSKDYRRVRKTFDARFDELMQVMNHKETNGIVVGPEISRVFAEIIFQDIDVAVEKEAEEMSLRRGLDFDIRRYVDDYYIFSNDESKIWKIKEIVESELRSYKLYVNPGKVVFRERPFVTNISVLANNLKDLIDWYFADAMETSQEDIYRQVRYRPRAARDRKVTWKNFLRRYRSLIYETDLSLGSGAAIVFGGIRKRLQQYERFGWCHASVDDEVIALQRFIADMGHVIRFILGASPNVSGLDSALKSLLLLREIGGCCGQSVTNEVDLVIERVFDDLFIDSERPKDGLEFLSLEFCSMLPLRRIIRERRQIDRDLLKHAWIVLINDAERSGEGFPYWPCIAFLYYAQGRDEYYDLKRSVLAYLVRWLRRSRIIDDTSAALAFLDVGGYPDFTVRERSALWRAAHRAYRPGAQIVWADATEYTERPKAWFVNWNLEVNIRQELEKKPVDRNY